MISLAKEITRSFNEHIELVASFAASATTAWLLKNKIFSFIRSIGRFLSAPARLEKSFNECMPKIESLVGEVKKINKALYNGGNDGIMQNIDLMKALSKSIFEAEPMPMFVCTRSGGNVRVNEAYRSLVKIWRDDEIGGTQWHLVLYGVLKDAYINGFEHHSAVGEDFIGDCDFRDPSTNEHRGRWKVHCVASRNTDGGMTYIGRFLACLDETANHIAEEHQWKSKRYVP